MRRILLPLLLALGALAAPAAAPAADAPAVPSLGVRVSSCQTGATAAQRGAGFSGAMPAIEGATGLAMRFSLEQRRGTTWKSLAVPGFSTWHRAAPGAAGFVYAKRVERLAPRASYRVEVDFRWTSADGKVRRRATRHSGICRQPELRPDLVLEALTPEPLGDGLVRYVARVRNDGKGAVTKATRVVLTVDGVAQAPQALALLATGAQALVAFEGPACAPGGTVRADVDPDDDVEEPDDADNAFVLRCPAA